MKWPTLIATQLVLAALLLPLPTFAGYFNPHLIISDEELRNASAMSYEQVRSFLREKGGLAETFDIDPSDGLLKNAAQLIFDAAGRYKVNPKYILALIQKESSAVETQTPTKRQLDWATGYSLCDSCSRTSAIAMRNQGLGKQIDSGAGYIKWFFDNAAASTGIRRPGVTYSISQTSVTPRNVATAALYTYTPHLHGNRLLWSIWNRWFDGGISSLSYPDGSLVRNEKTGAVALIQNGKFRPVLNRSVLASRFNENQIIDLNEYDFGALQDQRMGSPVKFSDYALVRTETGATYLLVGARRRRIASPQVFSKIGFNPEEVEQTTSADLEGYAEGEPITAESAAPSGWLAQNKTNGGVYFVEGESKHPLWDKAVLAANFPGRPIKMIASAELDRYKTGAPVKFNDGVLVRAAGSPSVYVISGGKKRSIPSEEVFVAFGYDWNAVLVTSPKVLNLMEAGDPLVQETR